ncbi:MAG: hypothetical protein OXF75_02185 [Acidimicrobiaceae bacterium]|nr:hypothetical protein [Acidimicrobiaceae bacterium]
MTKQLTPERAANAEHAAGNRHAAVHRWPDDPARTWTLDAVERAAANEAILAIVATGSSVRDVEHSDDLDLVLVYRGCRPVMPRPPISIDLRRCGHDEVLQKLKDGHDYLSWTVRYGTALFERGSWWTILRTDWKGRLSLPSVAEARERAQKAERLYQKMTELGDTDAAAELELSMLTFLGRAALSEAKVFPKSRPEIPYQLQEIGERELADRIVSALERRTKRTLADSTI